MASRAERLGEIVSILETAQGDVEGLRDELQEWLDNMPENLQLSAKAEQLEETIGDLEEVIGAIEEAIVCTGSVEFPGMY